MDRFANACTTIAFTISLKKTKLLAQTTTSLKITINNYDLEVVDKLYLESKIGSIWSVGIV